MHVQVDVLKGGVEISVSENTMVPDRQVDELFWLRDCWAPKVVDTGALARFHDYVAASSRPVAEPWRTVGPVTVVLDDQPRLVVETRLSIHHNTVMDLAISPSGHAASIDFFGHWSVWTQAKLREQTNGEFGREARAITLSDDGARIAALVNLGASALYNYDAFIVALGGPVMIRCAGHAVERIRWEGDFLVVGNMLGYRIHDAAGELICVDASPKGLSATCFVPVPPGGVLHCIRRSVLGGVEIGTDRALPCFDLVRLGLEGQPHWRPTSHDVRRAGDLVALGPGNETVVVVDLASGRSLVKLEIEGVQIVNMFVAFDASGRYLLMSATHIRGHQVTHLIYDGRNGVVIGRLTTSEGTFQHHARVVMSSDCRRVFAADGNTILVARLPSG